MVSPIASFLTSAIVILVCILGITLCCGVALVLRLLEQTRVDAGRCNIDKSSAAQGFLAIVVENQRVAKRRRVIDYHIPQAIKADF
jgi:hypothetical protein